MIIGLVAGAADERQGNERTRNAEMFVVSQPIEQVLQWYARHGGRSVNIEGDLGGMVENVRLSSDPAQFEDWLGRDRSVTFYSLRESLRVFPAENAVQRLVSLRGARLDDLRGRLGTLGLRSGFPLRPVAGDKVLVEGPAEYVVLVEEIVGELTDDAPLREIVVVHRGVRRSVVDFSKGWATERPAGPAPPDGRVGRAERASALRDDRGNPDEQQ